MKSLQNIPNNDPVHELTGVRLRIFCYLLQENEPVGVRETQRALGLKTASHASYHLQKLVEDKIADKTPQNSYFLLSKYKVKSVEINVLTEYYLLAGKFWPRTVFYAAYLFVSIIIALILLSTGLNTVLIYYLSISLVLTFVLATYEVYHQMNALPWEVNGKNQ